MDRFSQYLEQLNIAFQPNLCWWKVMQIAPFVERFNNNYFGKVSMMTINNTSINSRLSTRPFMKRGCSLLLSQSILNNYFGEIFMINAISTQNNLSEYCIFSGSLLILSHYLERALEKELRIAPFIEYFKQLLQRNFPDKCYQSRYNLPE